MKTKVSLQAAILATSLITTVWVQAASTVNFVIPSGGFKVAENAGAIALTVLRANDTETAVSVDYASSDLLGSAGLDYSAVAGTLTFAPGETSHSIIVPILNDGLVEGTETFRVALSNPTNAAVGTSSQATVSITDNDAGLQFEFGTLTFGSYQVAEGAGFILVGVMRCDDGDLPVSLEVVTTDGTAKSGLDYTGLTNTLCFSPGEKTSTFTVPILNDGIKEASRTFSLTLRNPTNQILGSQKTATVTILDNDLGVQFQPFNQYWIAENEGALTLTVTRGNDGNLDPFTVEFATANLTASAGVDYVATNGTLSFAQGEMAKTITVPILYDEVSEVDEKFAVTLSNPTGGAVLGP